MANTKTLGDGVIAITSIDADWKWIDDFPNSPDGIDVSLIMFSAGLDGDKIAIKDESASGALIFPKQPLKVQGPPTVVHYHGRRLKPFLDVSDSTIGGTLENLIIVLGGK